MRKFFLCYLLISLSIGALYAQEGSALRWLMQGDSLRLAYCFEEAVERYEQAVILSSDPLVRNRAERSIILCENGLNMLRYAVQPKVLGSAKISRESFYLYLNSDSRAFWAFPDAARFPEISQEYPAFVSPHNKTIIFTGKSLNSNNLNLYISRQSDDTLWSYPRLMESSVNSSGNECYPILSTDGQTLWFASDGHYGMGGFDLYVSHFDKESGTWNQAQNLGFPYSSTENDFAFMPAPDGLSALFISDRGVRGGQGAQGTSETQLVLYKVEYELNPERHDWRNRNDLISLAQGYFDTGTTERDTGKPSGLDSTVTSVDSDTLQVDVSDYTELVQTAKKIRDEVAAQERRLAASRDAYSRLSLEDDRLAFARKIEEEEMLLIVLQEKYRLAGVAVQKVETEFLQKGILPSFEPPSVQERDPSAASSLFAPQPGKAGSLDSFLFAAPIIVKEPIDVSFRMGKESIIIPEEEMPLPDYLFYRIQISTTPAPANASAFKGISPIFETVTSAAKYLYAAGHFNNYAEASKALTQVQQSGFRNAVVIAYNQGKSVALSTARRLEPAAPKAMYRLSLGAHPQGLPQALSNAINELSNKDLARITGGWESKYVVGPFSTMQEAQALQQSLVELGFEGIIIEIINP